ncbi:PAS domain S-box protein [Pedobacter rhodius]|uniref:histidine kinase n=1 Tax=Pedobacter rhodius TaxID=3004098 RepID=A0ABT4KUK9_9SPHI|nr:PAS domain S-box protein [Pedobacter sp. SJ11]MCZ4222603.1 PAS domain S-box protein [Pedobacter sp. SJ11]
MLKDIFRQFFCKSSLAAMLIKIVNSDHQVVEVTDVYLEQAGIDRTVFFTETSKYLLPGFTTDKKNNKAIFDALIQTVLTDKVTALTFFSENLKKNYSLAIEPLSNENGGHQYFILTLNPIAATENLVSEDKDLNYKELTLGMERFNYLVRDGLDMIAILDDAGNYRYVSNTSFDLLGFSSDYYIGRNAFEFIHPEDLEEAQHAFKGIQGRSRVALKPFRFLHQNGTWRWVQTVLSDLRNEPSVKGIVANSRDVTEQINIRNDVLISNERYKYVTRATSEAIWDWDIASGKLIWGEGFLKLFGYSAEEIETAVDTFRAKIHPEDLDAIKDGIQRLLENKETHWFGEYRLKKADGEYAFVADKGLVIFDKKGTPIRMVGAMQDVTSKKQEEQRLKMLESVVINTADSVAIMSVDLTKFPISQFIYVNEAFLKMTGYSFDELIGKSPRILEGPRTDQKQVNKIIKSLLKGIPGEVTLINYKKNREEFWLNLSVTPIADSHGNINRWISIQRDITEEKTEAIRQKLISGISVLFNRFTDIKKASALVLNEIAKCGNFCNAELWLPDANENHLKLFARSKADKQIEDFYKETADFTIAKKGQGLVGKVWEEMKRLDIALSDQSVGGRIPAAIKIGIKHIYGLPLTYNGKLVGILALAGRNYHNLEGTAVLSDVFSEFLAGKIKRKHLEQELGEVFEFAPDILATIDYHGYFKRINPAAAELLGYSESELLQKPVKFFVHPLDRLATARKIKNITDSRKAMSFENRYVTKSGQLKWLSWTANAVSADGVIFAVAKDITEKKMLADLLQKTTSLARIGSWEINVVDRTVYWSDVTKEIREVEPDFVPDLDTGMDNFKEGFSKDTIKKKVQECMDNGTPWDEELEIVTFKGNLKWVRTIGQAEMLEGKCIRIFGSFQDIDARKRTEILNKEILREVAESEKKYSELFHFSPLPMWVYDAETFHFLDVNLSAIKHYGYSREEFLAITVHDILANEEFMPSKSIPENTGEDDISSNRGIYKHITKNGTTIQVDMRSNPMFFKGKDARLVVASDITKELLYVKEIEEKNLKLREIAWIQSHTVRAPLARIMGLVDILGNNKKQKIMSQSDILKQIESSAEELDKIIKEIAVKSDKTN